MGAPTYIIEGSWIGQSKFIKSESKNYSINALFADASGEDDSSKRGILVKPIEEQGDMESRRVWKDVADGIRKGDFESAGIAKSKLENEQRAKRKNEKEGNSLYKLQKFKEVESDEDCKSCYPFFLLPQPSSTKTFSFRCPLLLGCMLTLV